MQVTISLHYAGSATNKDNWCQFHVVTKLSDIMVYLIAISTKLLFNNLPVVLWKVLSAFHHYLLNIILIHLCIQLTDTYLLKLVHRKRPKEYHYSFSLFRMPFPNNYTLDNFLISFYLYLRRKSFLLK